MRRGVTNGALPGVEVGEVGERGHAVCTMPAGGGSAVPVCCAGHRLEHRKVLLCSAQA